MRNLIKYALIYTLGSFLLPILTAKETTTLQEMLNAVKSETKTSMSTRPLAHDWIGDIIDEKNNIRRLRLEKGSIFQGNILLLRTSPQGSFLASDAPKYVKSIPSSKKLRSCSTVAEIQKILGTGQPGFSGWGGPQGMHSSHSWVCFSSSGKNTLTYINIFAHTSFSEEQIAKGIIQINELSISRGKLRRADPNNKKELSLYLSGADLQAAEEAEKAKKRQQFPQPLRDLIKIDEHPNDSDLKHLKAAINIIRKNPDPKLFTQLVQEMHEGTLRIRSLLTYILLDQNGLLGLKPWETKKEAMAVKACIDALPTAKEGARDDLVEILLRVSGGGKMSIVGQDGGRCIEVTPTKDGHQLTLSGAENPLSVEQAQKKLLQLYKKSRAKK